MIKTSVSTAILERLAGEGRLVLSDWRAMIYLRRASFSLPASGRRWSEMPAVRTDVWQTLRRMRGRGELEQIPGIRHFYRANVPYARGRAVEEEEALMEAHPYAALADFSALFFHGLTEAMPKGVTAVFPADGKGGLLPADTTAEDWEEIEIVGGRRVASVVGREVGWRRVESARYFGFEVYRGRGYSVRATTPERTLVDGLLHPERSGGIQSVLRAWALACDVLDEDSVVHQVERLGVGVLRQRVGFVMERLGLSHAALGGWRAAAERGGSRKLLASAPYSSNYDERWDLSINAPVDALEVVA